MATDDVEIVRAHIEAFLAGDTERSTSFLDEHVVRDWTRIGILYPTSHGIDEVVQGTFHYRAAFGDYDWAAMQVADLGSGQVLVEFSEKAEGKGSGAPVERSSAVLYTVIARKIVRITAFPSAHDARAAVGAPSNLEVFRRSLAAFDRGDRDTWLALLDKDFEVLPSATFPQVEVVRGPEASWDFYVEVTEPFEPHAYLEDVQAEEIAPDKVLVHQRSAVRGRASGADVVLEYWVVMTYRDQKAVRAEWFRSRAEALASTGGTQ